MDIYGYGGRTFEGRKMLVTWKDVVDQK